VSLILELCERQQLPLTISQILAWAEAHHVRNGTWPAAGSGRIAESPRETWSAVNRALREGERGLPGGNSLYRLLRQEGRIHERRGRPAQPKRGLLASILRARGHTLAEIGQLLGVSRQRAFQLLHWTPAPC
jgi:hypothetical protein